MSRIKGNNNLHMGNFYKDLQSHCIRIISSLLGGERILIVCWETSFWGSRIRWGIVNRVARGDHLLLFWRRVEASRLSLVASRLSLITSSRLLRLITSRLLQLITSRLLLRVTWTSLHRLCWLVNCTPIPVVILCTSRIRRKGTLSVSWLGNSRVGNSSSKGQGWRGRQERQ